jgi:hypothetical protein
MQFAMQFGPAQLQAAGQLFNDQPFVADAHAVTACNEMHSENLISKDSLRQGE